jgi:hypothetical protein
VPAREGHVETTTAAASVTPAGLGPLGHRQAHRPARPQGTGTRAVRDPLGWPGTPTVVAGQTADAPRELPEMAQVRQSAPCTGLTSVGDGPRAALGPRAKSVAPQEDSWGPLSAPQRPAGALARERAPVLRVGLEPSARRWPTADGARAEPAAPVAIGWASTIARRAREHARPTRTWQERPRVVRALALAARQEQS